MLDRDEENKVNIEYPEFKFHIYFFLNKNLPCLYFLPVFWINVVSTVSFLISTNCFLFFTVFEIFVNGGKKKAQVNLFVCNIWQ